MVVFLHVPHTGGRSLNRALWRAGKSLTRLHNPEQIEEYLSSSRLSSFPGKDPLRYFILRSPLKRSKEEYLHYTRRLQEIGVVNHLDLAQIRKKRPKFNPERDYYSLEENRNLYCKFILLRKDFSLPLTEEDFSQIEKLFQEGKLVYDLFDPQGTNHRNLRSLLNLDFDLGSPSFSPSWSPTLLPKGLEEANLFDLRLYSLLSLPPPPSSLPPDYHPDYHPSPSLKEEDNEDQAKIDLQSPNS